jgi:hypothetical protein
MSSLIGKTGSGTYESEKDAYDFNNNIIEQQKQQLNQVKTELAKTKREIIASMIPRNLPQYRSDEDFEKELEYRVNSLNEYTTIEDLKGLYDAKLWKHAKSLAAKTASMEALDGFNFIQNPMHNIAGNNMVYSNNNRDSNSNNIHRYDPIASHYNNYPRRSSSSRGRTASLGNSRDSPFWYLDLFDTTANYSSISRGG